MQSTPGASAGAAVRDTILIRPRMPLEAAHSGTVCEPSSTGEATVACVGMVETPSPNSVVTSHVANGAVNGDAERVKRSSANSRRSID